MSPTFEGKRTRNAYSSPCARRDHPVVWSAGIIGRFWALSTIRNPVLAGFSASGQVLAAGILRSRLSSPAHLPRLYLSLGGQLKCPNSQHDFLHHFGVINVPNLLLISLGTTHTRSVSPANQRDKQIIIIGLFSDTEAKHTESAGYT